MAEEKIGSKGQCPACRESIAFRGWVRVKAFYCNPPSDKELRSTSRVSSASFECPKCRKPIRVGYEIRLIELVSEDGQHVTKIADTPESVKPRLETEEERLIKICRENGMLKSFETAVLHQTGNDNRPPEYLEKYFVNYVRGAVKVKVEGDLLKQFSQEFPGRLEFWQAYGVIMVVSGGRICRFISQKAMNLRKDKSEKPELYGARLTTGEQAWDGMIRTRHGYVPPTSGVHHAALIDHLGKGARVPRTPPPPSGPPRLVPRSSNSGK